MKPEPSAGGSACDPATQEAEIRRVMVQSQPRPIVCETQTPIQKRAGGVAQDVVPEFKPQHYKKTKKQQQTKQ
jgi:hypothetical protein